MGVKFGETKVHQPNINYEGHLQGRSFPPNAPLQSLQYTWLLLGLSFFATVTHISTCVDGTCINKLVYIYTNTIEFALAE